MKLDTTRRAALSQHTTHSAASSQHTCSTASSQHITRTPCTAPSWLSSRPCKPTLRKSALQLALRNAKSVLQLHSRHCKVYSRHCSRLYHLAVGTTTCHQLIVGAVSSWLSCRPCKSALLALLSMLQLCIWRSIWRCSRRYSWRYHSAVGAATPQSATQVA